jgi:hypothetical protein
MKISIHLTNSRGLWFWSLTDCGTALCGSDRGFVSAVAAQGDARAAVAKYRRFEALFA